MANIRYPGSKHKLRKTIIGFFPLEFTDAPLFSEPNRFYVEPFFGSGAIGWMAMTGLKFGTQVVINDIDYWIQCLWIAVRDGKDELIGKIKSAQLSPALFEEYKAMDGDRSLDPVEAGFRKLLLHQMSFSGLGAKAGGPIGGCDQTNAKYTITARWNPSAQIQMVEERSILLNRHKAEITSSDFEVIIRGWDSKNTLFYLDPPYVAKGPDLYRHHFGDKDHLRLRKSLDRILGRFILSYDDHPMVRDLYSDFKIAKSDATYSICTSRKNNELIITNF